MLRPRRRTLGLATLAPVVVACSLALAAQVSAADPDIEPLLDTAAEAGLECTQGAPDSWLCLPPDFGAPGSVSIETGEAFAGFSATVYRDGASPGALDIHELMDRYVAVILGDDPEARAWLADAQAEGQAFDTFERAGWRLEWSTIGPGDGGEARTMLIIARDPTAVGPSPSPDEPAASLAPPLLQPGELAESSLGTWTYTGTWTVVAQINDGGFEFEPPVGTAQSAQLVVTCPATDRPCTVSRTILGGPTITSDAVILAPGQLRAVWTYDPDLCPVPEQQTWTLEMQHGPSRAVGTEVLVNEPRTCVNGNTTNYQYDTTSTFDGTLASFAAAPGPPSTGVATPVASAAPGPASTPPVGSSGDGSGSDGQAGSEPFAASVPTAEEVSRDPTVLLQSAVLAALLVFLMPFPSQLFNSTLEAHEDRVRRRLRLDRIGSALASVGGFWASWPGVVTFTLLAAILYGFLDPTFGAGPGSLATLLGLLIGIVAVTIVFALPLIALHRANGDRAWVQVVPVSLLIGIGCVLVSRLTDFQPGYLYGLLIGVGFARELSAAAEARATAIAAGVMLLVAFGAWMLLGSLPEGDSFGLLIARTAMAALLVAGLEGVVFGLLPMRFLPGESLYRWSRPLWAFLLLVGAFAFFHILINPASGYLSDTSRTPLLTVVVLLVGFSLASIAFWAWFRMRPDPPAGHP